MLWYKKIRLSIINSSYDELPCMPWAMRWLSKPPPLCRVGYHYYYFCCSLKCTADVFYCTSSSDALCSNNAACKLSVFYFVMSFAVEGSVSGLNSRALLIKKSKVETVVHFDVYYNFSSTTWLFGLPKLEFPFLNAMFSVITRPLQRWVV